MANHERDESPWALAETGVAGLDEILHGGLSKGQMYLIEGESGAGKTMIGMQFAVEGLRRGETVIYLALSETRKDLERLARSHGWDIEKLVVMEASSIQEEPSSMFHPFEAELDQAIQNVKEAVDRVKPARLVLDSLSEFRIIGQGNIRYRRSLLSLKRVLASFGCTVLLLEETSREERPRSLVDGVICLEMFSPDYGGERRKLRICKQSGRSYIGGFHDYFIRTGGVVAFPRLIASEYRTETPEGILNSGLNELDAMLGGGIPTGSSTLIAGQAGSGKTNVSMLFVASAVSRGETALVFTFEERPERILRRSESLGLDLQAGLDDGRLYLQQVDPAELSPGRFAHIIRQQIEARQVSLVVIDSLNGYLHAMPDERFLILHLHELLAFLGNHGVATFLVLTQTGMGGSRVRPVNTSYLTDNVLLIQFFESKGEIRRNISVVKQRGGRHEQTIRELHFDSGRISIGEPLREFQGILTGTPIFQGASEDQLGEDDVSSY
jgi:circadian clock protein KaiC